jgi:hypothetical protein
MTNDRLWPRPYVDALAVAGIVVDAGGTVSPTKARVACTWPTPLPD